MQKGSSLGPLTLSIHPYYNKRIPEEDYKANSMNLHEFHRGMIQIETNFSDLGKMKLLFTSDNLKKIIS